MRRLSPCVSVLLCLRAWRARAASAQTIETVGERALGMGGAFVAVADDSSATWWNPGRRSPPGPFVDVAARLVAHRMSPGRRAAARGPRPWPYLFPHRHLA